MNDGALLSSFIAALQQTQEASQKHCGFLDFGVPEHGLVMLDLANHASAIFSYNMRKW